MRPIISSESLAIPDGVQVGVKARVVTVSGPRGTLKKDLGHLVADLFVTTDEDGQRRLKVECHFRKRKELSALRTVTGHVSNMITGVTKGFRYKMRLVYAHFPINANAESSGSALSVRNFLGEKIVRTIPMADGVTVSKDADVKDQLLFEGNSIDQVSRSCALVHQSCLVKHKDIRKFLDGIYVSEKGTIVE